MNEISKWPAKLKSRHANLLEAAYTLIDAGDCKINKEGTPLTGLLKGKYDPNLIHALNLNFVDRY
jgi:hypothetical protein